MVVYGTKDIGGAAVSQKLGSMPNSRTMPYKDAPHPCYLGNYIDQWHRDVYNFVNYVAAAGDDVTAGGSAVPGQNA